MTAFLQLIQPVNHHNITEMLLNYTLNTNPVKLSFLFWKMYTFVVKNQYSTLGQYILCYKKHCKF